MIDPSTHEADCVCAACLTNHNRRVMTLLTEEVLAIAVGIRAGCDRAKDAGMLVDYPENVWIDDVKFSFSVLLEEADRRAPRLIARVVTDGISTKDGMA